MWEEPSMGKSPNIEFNLLDLGVNMLKTGLGKLTITNTYS